MISFIIPAYNEEKYLPATLEAIHDAAREVGEPYEVVVANDNSTDSTASIAEQAGAHVVTVSLRQIAGTRNAGARAAKGDMLLFVDADTTVNAPLVAQAVAAMRAGAIGGGAPVRFDRSPFWARALMLLVIPMFRLFKWAAGCFVYCTREGFEKSGGFDERYYASEEIHFSQALKRHGRFQMLRAYVTSSSRKLDTYSPWRLLGIVSQMLLAGPAGLRKRSPLTDFWYPDKR